MPSLSLLSFLGIVLVVTGPLQFVVQATRSALPAKVNTFQLGGLFNPFNLDSVANVSQIHSLAACMMAIDEINNDPNLLPTTRLKISVLPGRGTIETVFNSVTQCRDSFNGTGVDFVIGNLDNAETIQTLAIQRAYDVSQMIVSADTADISAGVDVNNEVRIIPVQAYIGIAMQGFLLDRLKLERIVTFVTADPLRTHQFDELNDKAFGDFKFLSPGYVLNPLNDDYSHQIAAAIDDGAKVFVLFLDSRTTGKLLEQGYKSGLFKEGSFILSADGVLSEPVWNYMSPDAPVEDIMKGFSFLSYDPMFWVQHSTKGTDFVSRLQAYVQSINCASSTDDEGRLIYKDATSGACAVNQISTVINTTSVASPAAFAYDAVYAIANSLDQILRENPGTAPSALEPFHLQSHMQNETTNFWGVTSQVMFISENEATTNNLDSVIFPGYSGGDREKGFVYNIYNFHADAYRADILAGGNGQNGYVKVGHWNDQDEDPTFQLCDGGSTEMEGDIEIPCDGTEYYSMIYNTVGNRQPRDHPADIISTVSLRTQRLYATVSYIGIALTLLFAVLLVHNRENRIVKTAQPGMMLLILFGELLAFIVSLISTMPLSPAICYLHSLLTHLAMFLVFGGVVLKSWRLNRIMTATQTLSRSKVSGSVVITRCVSSFLVIAFVVALICGLTLSFEPVTSSELIHNQLTIYPQCPLRLNLESLLLFFEIVLVVLAMYYAAITWELPNGLNESKSILISSVMFFVIGAVLEGAAFVNNTLSPVTLRANIASMTLIIAFTTLLACIGPRVLYILRRDTLSKNFLIVKRHKGFRFSFKPKSIPKSPVPSGVVAPDGEVEDGDDLTKAIRRAIKYANSDEERMAICQQKIHLLKTMTIRINCGEWSTSHLTPRSSTHGNKSNTTGGATDIQKDGRKSGSGGKGTSSQGSIGASPAADTREYPLSHHDRPFIGSTSEKATHSSRVETNI